MIRGCRKGETIMNFNTDTEQRTQDFANEYPESIAQLADRNGSISDIDTFLRIAARGEISNEEVARTIATVSANEKIGNVPAYITSVLRKRAENRQRGKQSASVLLSAVTIKEEPVQKKQIVKKEKASPCRVDTRFEGELAQGIADYAREHNCSMAAAVRELVATALNRPKVADVDGAIEDVCASLRRALDKLEKLDTSNEDDLYNFDV